MVKKVLDNLGFVGGLTLLVGLLIWNFQGVWNLGVQIAVYGGLALMGIYLIAQIPNLVAALRTRGGKQGSSALISLLLVVGILVLVNFLNYRRHQRWDLSEGNLNSLSEQSLKVALNLDREVEVLGFFEDPGEALEFEDMMKEYQFASSRIGYQVVNPLKDPARVERYQVDRRDQIVVASADKTQKVNRVNEQDITNAIIKVTRDELKVVYFLTGHGERSIDSSEADGFLATKGAVERQNYLARSLNLAVEGKIPEDASVLVAPGIRSNFLPGEVTLLDQYLAAGGKLLLMLEPQTNFEMNDFLTQYGVQVDDNFILDPSLVGQVFGLGPAAPIVGVYRPHPITEDFNYSTFFPTARSLEAVESALGYRSQALFSSSGQSWGETELKSDQRPTPDEGKDKLGPLTLAVVSVLTPEKESDELGGEVPEEMEKTGQRESRLVVVGDSDFVANRFLQGPGPNLDLFLNMVSWLLQDEDLIAVRPKDPTNRKVVLNERDANILWWGLVVFLPIATLVLGMSIWYRRR